MKGQFTFDAEGTEGGRYHSRKLHVPSQRSGLTIGRGYDMASRKPLKILADLRGAGVPAYAAKLISGAAGLRGQEAERFVAMNLLEDFEIGWDDQKSLFRGVYLWMENEVKRICRKPDVVARYGLTDWEGLREEMKVVLVDLRFRGDYTGWSRRRIQPAVVANDLVEFSRCLNDRDNWKKVPKDRFLRRAVYLSSTVQNESRYR